LKTNESKILLAKIKKSCFDNKLSPECSKARWSARFSLLEKQSKDKRFEDLNKAELISRLTSPFRKSSDISKINYQEVAKVADEIIAQDDTIYAAYKVKLISEFLPLLLKLEGSSKDAVFSAMKKLESFNYLDHDPEIIDTKALIYSHTKDKARLKDFFQQVQNEKPNSGSGYYLEAMYHDLENDKKRIRESLEKASEIEPDNKKYKESLRDFNKGEKNFFQFSLTFDFDDL